MRRAPDITYIENSEIAVAQRVHGQIIICAGSRQWNDFEKIYNTLVTYNDRLRIDYIIHGNNGYDAHGKPLDQIDSDESDIAAIRGADKLSGRAAIKLHIPVLRFPPDWKNNGRAAGPKRNLQMIQNGMPTCAILFHDALHDSVGTANLKRLLDKYNIPYEVVHH